MTPPGHPSAARQGPFFESMEPRLLLESHPVISEFLAVNGQDVYPDHPTLTETDWDWIEIHNPTGSAIDLAGYHLTDDDGDLAQWTFPDDEAALTTLPAGGYLLVYASKLTGDPHHPDPEHPDDFHCNFKLDGDGEYLALLGPDPNPDAGDILHEFAPEFPEQVEDVSYGLPDTEVEWYDLVSPGHAVTWHVPTPGEDATAWTDPLYDDSGWATTVSEGLAGLLVTEVRTGGGTSFVELQNVSDAAIDTAGWTVVVNDPDAGASDVLATGWPLPGSVAAGEVLYRTDDAGDAGHYWGEAIPWDAEGPGWVAVLDDAGGVMDYVAWGYTAAEIDAVAFDYGAFAGVTVDDAWSGDGAPVGSDTGVPDAGFTAYNDHIAGAGTHANTTTYAAIGTASGYLSDIDTGADTAVTLTVSDSGGLNYAGSQSNPAPGTDAYDVFNGYVDLGSATNSSIEIRASYSQSLTHTFSGLDTGDVVTYDFTGTAVRGGGYHDRWTLVTLDGAEAFTPAHSTGIGVVTDGLAPNQVAFWAGENNLADQGFVAAWTGIDPGADGVFDVVSAQYTGPIPTAVEPSGMADGSKGYGLSGVRLTEIAPSGPTYWLKRSGDTDTDGADDFARDEAGSQGVQNPGLTVPFGEILTAFTGVGFSAGDPAFDALIETDVGEAMQGTNASLWCRMTFAGDDLPPVDTLILRMKYDDGFIAYLNGAEVASRNAPATPAWDSTATAEHPNAQAVVYEEIDLSPFILDVLNDGSNVLAIHGLNLAAADADFLLVPEMVARSSLPPNQYMTTPTPGAENAEGALGLVDDTAFSIDRGFYTDPIAVEITCDTPGADIYWTVDGSEPNPGDADQRYTGPITIDTTTVLRAVAHKPGYIPSNVDTQTYLFLADVIAQDGAGFPDGTWGYGGRTDYEMDPEITTDPAYQADMIEALTALPALSIGLPVEDIFGSSGLYANPGSTTLEKAASAELFYADGSGGWQVDCGLKMQGGASRLPYKAPKHSMSLRFRNLYGPGRLETSLFEDWPIDRFNSLQLRAMFNNSWIHWDSGQRSRGSLIRDQWMRDTLIDMGHLDAGNGIYVHLYLDGLYWGVYNLHERQEASHYAEYHGGDDDQLDAINAGSVIDGTGTSWNNLHNMVDSAADGVITLAEYDQIRQRLDVTSLADYMIANHYGANRDWDHHNWRAAGGGPDDAPWRIYSWDAERVLEDVGTSVLGTNNDDRPSRLFHNLRQSEEFRILFADRLQKHLFNGGALTPDAAEQRWMDYGNLLDLAVIGESARWGDYRRDVHSSSNGPYELYTRNDHWIPEQQRLLTTHFPYRTGNVLNQYLGYNLYPKVSGSAFYGPEFSQFGGEIPDTGADLTITNPNASGTVFYTLDGTDPRAYGTGSIVGTPYSGPIALDGATHVKARVYHAGEGVWSALVEATFVPDTPPGVRVTELMYNPAPPTADEWLAGFGSAGDFEFLELQNVSAESVNLAGLRFADGLRFEFSTFALDPGEFGLVVRNRDAFEMRYGTAASDRILGEFRWQTALNNAGETVTLSTLLGEVVQTVDFKDGWFGLTDGDGFSLVPRDPAQDPALWSAADGWRTSWQVAGSPGAADTGIDPAAVVVNELLAHSNGTDGDWVELYNASADPVDLAGWFLSDNPADLAKYEITGYVGGTVLSPGEYLVLNERDHFGPEAPDPGRHTAFAFSEFGEDVYLTAAVEQADIHLAGGPADWPAHWNLGGYREDEHFGATPGDQSLGRFAKPSGGKDFVLTSAPTSGAANDGPFIPDVVLNELMYHPPTEPLHEYVELYNRTDAPVPLWQHFDLDGYPDMDVGWALTDGVDFTFPAGSVDGAYVPAGGYALVVPIEPATFRSTYLIPDSVKIYGPFENDTRLSNGGERVALSRPGKPEINEPPPGQTAPYVPYIEIEKITYDDDPPWPTEPDGDGPSLERIAPDLYANDPAHWEASDDPGGTPGAPNEAIPPRVTTVALNPDAGRTLRTVSGIEPSGLGVETVEITFSEAVTFTADAVTVQTVHVDAGVDVVDYTFTAGEVTVDGSGTHTMAVTIIDSHIHATDTWVKVTVSDEAAVLADSDGLAGATTEADEPLLDPADALAAPALDVRL